MCILPGKVLQATKKFYEQKQAHVQMILRNQPNYMGMIPQYIHTIPTDCAILATMPCVCQPSECMRSEGYSIWSVCLCV